MIKNTNHLEVQLQEQETNLNQAMDSIYKPWNECSLLDCIKEKQTKKKRKGRKKKRTKSNKNIISLEKIDEEKQREIKEIEKYKQQLLNFLSKNKYESNEETKFRFKIFLEVGENPPDMFFSLAYSKRKLLDKGYHMNTLVKMTREEHKLNVENWIANIQFTKFLKHMEFEENKLTIVHYKVFLLFGGNFNKMLPTEIILMIFGFVEGYTKDKMAKLEEYIKKKKKLIKESDEEDYDWGSDLGDPYWDYFDELPDEDDDLTIDRSDCRYHYVEHNDYYQDEYDPGGYGCDEYDDYGYDDYDDWDYCDDY